MRVTSTVMAVFDIDAEIENLDRKLLAEVVKGKIANVITSYREDRSPKVLLEHAAYALGLTVVFALLFWGILRVFRRLDAWAVRHVHKGVQDLASKSHHLIQAEQIWTLVAGLLSTLRVLTLVVLIYSYLNTALGLFPWTRPVALILFDLVLNPIKSLWYGFVDITAGPGISCRPVPDSALHPQTVAHVLSTRCHAAGSSCRTSIPTGPCPRTR